jgi:hypothetical protein
MKAGSFSVKIAAALTAGLWLANLSLAAEPNMPMPSPQAVYDNALRDATPKGKGTGEGFCWHAAYHMGIFVKGYEASRDPAWLDWGVKFYDWCVNLMAAGPDGYKGWIGPAGNGLWYDDHVGDSILVERMLEFSELVLKDPALKAKYGESADKYVALAKRDLIEKWDKRNTWREDGEYGCYVAHDKACEPEKLTVWKTVTEGVDEPPGRTLPFNKQNEMALAALRLYRITGEKPYLDKASKIFSFMRSRFIYVADKDYYCWNYWGPFGPWDVDLNKKVTRHWTGVHAYRNYQATEIYQIVEAYHTGIVFTSLDIERIINTNLKVMWNGDKAAPKWVNSNALLPKAPLTPAQKKAQEDAENRNPYAKEGRAGILWTSLDDFSQTARDLAALAMNAPSTDTQELVGRAYFQNVTLKTPVSMDRRYAKDAKVAQVPATNCPSLYVAAVLPHILAKEPSVVLCKSSLDSDIEVAVYSEGGKDKKCVLFKGKIGSGMAGLSETLVFTWDGADPATKTRLSEGNYVLRWTVSDGYRDYPIVIAK